jgi:hypothetical protein
MSERYLLTRAEEIVNRQGPQDGVARAEQLRAARQNIQEHCDHAAGFRYSRGEGQCENCNHDMPDFTYDCRRCGTQWCKRCSLNRA